MVEFLSIGSKGAINIVIGKKEISALNSLKHYFSHLCSAPLQRYKKIQKVVVVKKYTKIRE